MKRSKKNEDYPVRISLYAVILAVFWTALVGISLMWVISQQREGTLETARIQARYSFMKDVTYRRWNAEHGGVYAPVTERTPPNPYLDLKGRDIPGPSGKTLTKINPAYMTRQVHELALKTHGIRGHITSLNPIRPKNAPDPWETLALKEFEHGKKEVSTVRDLEGHSHMRLMRPLLTEKGCLKCHRAQGYQEGDIRGGISISVPLTPLWAVEKSHLLAISLGHGLIWLVGLAGIGFGARRLNGQIADLRQARQALRVKEEAVRRGNEEWERTFNTVPDLIIILDHEHRIVKANKAMADRLGLTPGEMVGQTCYEHVHGSKDPLPSCPHSRLLMDGKEHSEEVWEERLGGWFAVTVTPLLDRKDGNLRSVHVAHDITEQIKAREERESLISELETALANVKQLSGLLPICASCKKIRDDNGYWTQIEGYIRDRSEADFSHSICPECAKKLYPDFV